MHRNHARLLFSSLCASFVVAATACGPAKTGTESATATATAPATSSTSTGDEPATGGATRTTGPGGTTTTTHPTTTTATGGPSGCVATSEAACKAAKPLDEGNGCFWVTEHIVRLNGTVCAVEPAAECHEVIQFEGGPGCDGLFVADGDAVRLINSLDCGEPVAGGWSACFPQFDFETLADPACVCLAPQYCPDQPDQATCEAASNVLQTCGWSAGACV